MPSNLCVMGEVIHLLAGFVRLMIVGNTAVRILTLLVVGGLVGAIVVNERKRNQTTAAAAFRAVLLHNQTDTLHIVARNAPPPASIRNNLRPFDTPEDVYDYVYKKYDEPVYRHVVLHRPGSDPVEFLYDKNKSHDENLAGLSAQLV